MTPQVIIGDTTNLCIEGIIARQEECIAMIFTFVTNYHPNRRDRSSNTNYNFLEARINGANKEIYKSFLFSLHNFNEFDVTYSCAL